MNIFLTIAATLLTTLGALLMQEGVNRISDISQAAYASAVVGALITGISTYRALHKLPPRMNHYL